MRRCFASLAAAASCLAVHAAFAQAPASAPAAPLDTAYRDAAARIIASVEKGNDGWRKLEHLCLRIGHRLSGSESHTQALEWARKTLEADGHENVRIDPVEVSRWVRGEESLEMIEPRRARLAMLGLGGSVATPPEGITAEVVSVPDQDALAELGEEKIRGKIVLFDVPMSGGGESRGSGYGTAARYRGMGARWASEYGAVAALVRSATTRSLRTPHTGAMNYFDAKVRIPTCSVSTEDAEMITRLQAAGVTVRVTLKMNAKTDEKPAPSGNVIAELRGRERPEEVVVIGGHIDSWDVGQGAHDDGGGCVTMMEALNVLRKLELRPRRTIRVVLFTNEENGLAGGRDYAKRYADVLKDHVAAIESDNGTFAMLGIGCTIDAARREAADARLKEILELLKPLGAETLDPSGGGADIGPMRDAGVPLLSPRVDMTHYFDYHHTEADTLDKVNPEHLNKKIGAMAILSYILADMPDRLGDPR
ncbi:MAG: M20/M25/M40 family metallo-hydrolase [Phycisphaerales bacterium]|nr:M20/M25/M40 family metallo-hydrolase [Phycisphaerales bacterium]